MKEENQNVKEREIAEDQIDFRALLFKYIIHWPWFIGAVLLCFVGAWFYLHWATPIYNISATVLIKDGSGNIINGCGPMQIKPCTNQT